MMPGGTQDNWRRRDRAGPAARAQLAVLPQDTGHAFTEGKHTEARSVAPGTCQELSTAGAAAHCPGRAGLEPSITAEAGLSLQPLRQGLVHTFAVS